MPPRAQSALAIPLSHSLQFLPYLCSFVCISTFLLNSCPFLLFFFNCCCLLPSSVWFFFALLYPPSSRSTSIAAHMATHTDHSTGSTVDKSKGLAGTCHQQHPPACLPACLHRTTPYLLLLYTGLLLEDLHTHVWVRTRPRWKILFGKLKKACNKV